MKIRLFLIRKIKHFLIKRNLYKVFSFLVFPTSFFAYLVMFTKWRKEFGHAEYNDFPRNNFVSGLRTELYDSINKRFINNEAVDYLEFGVYRGNSFKWWVASNNNGNSKFTGFD